MGHVASSGPENSPIMYDILFDGEHQEVSTVLSFQFSQTSRLEQAESCGAHRFCPIESSAAQKHALFIPARCGVPALLGQSKWATGSGRLHPRHAARHQVLPLVAALSCVPAGVSGSLPKHVSSHFECPERAVRGGRSARRWHSDACHLAIHRSRSIAQAGEAALQRLAVIQGGSRMVERNSDLTGLAVNTLRVFMNICSLFKVPFRSEHGRLNTVGRACRRPPKTSAAPPLVLGGRRHGRPALFRRRVQI